MRRFLKGQGCVSADKQEEESCGRRNSMEKMQRKEQQQAAPEAGRSRMERWPAGADGSRGCTALLMEPPGSVRLSSRMAFSYPFHAGWTPKRESLASCAAWGCTITKYIQKEKEVRKNGRREKGREGRREGGGGRKQHMVGNEEMKLLLPDPLPTS